MINQNDSICGPLVMTDGAKISILHPCPTSEGIDLGVTYLWIDKLCICQDDDQEKREEIYAGARMTIVRADAENADETLPGVYAYNPPMIGQRPTPRSQDQRDYFVAPKIIDYSLLPRRQIHQGSRKIRAEWTISPYWWDTPYDREPHRSVKCPWHHRSWTMQEGLLSRRVLLVTSRQVYFRCLLVFSPTQPIVFVTGPPAQSLS